MSVASCISTAATPLISDESAEALTGRSCGLMISNLTEAVLGNNAPGQRLGLKALIGVRGRIFAPSGTIGPPAEEL